MWRYRRGWEFWKEELSKISNQQNTDNFPIIQMPNACAGFWVESVVEMGQL
jgi:hypothetical protein